MLTVEAISRKTGLSTDEVERMIERAKRSVVPQIKRIIVRERGRDESLVVVRHGVGPLLTKHGVFEQFDFSIDDRWVKYSVIVRAPLSDDFTPRFQFTAGSIKMRIDSGCETGQMFGDLTCECRDQLDLALARIAEAGEGLVINIPGQDGRGLRLPHKLATLRLQQEFKIDTVESGALLVPDGSKDIRTYAGAIAILKFLGIDTSITIILFTNNNEKQGIFSENGYNLKTEPLVIPATEHTRIHLMAKQVHLGHTGLVGQEDDP